MGNPLSQHPGAGDGSPRACPTHRPAPRQAWPHYHPGPGGSSSPQISKIDTPAPLMGVESSLQPKRLLSVSPTSRFPEAKIQNFFGSSIPPMQGQDRGRLAGLFLGRGVT